MHDKPKELDITLGPFHYRLRAVDNASASGLGRLAAEWVTGSRGQAILRDCTLAEVPLDEAMLKQLSNGFLPQRLLELLPRGAPHDCWEAALEPLKQVTWWHPTAGLSLTVAESAPAALGSHECEIVRFHLPWYALFRDVLAAGGCIVHGGLAERAGAGYLFAGAAGSGKSTALARLRAPWQVLSDDASLVWPEDDGWYASPLPTWSYILGEQPSRPDLVPWQVERRLRLERLFFLAQEHEDALCRLGAAQTARLLYLAAAEYPAVFSLRYPFRRDLFAFAASLARGIPAWMLELTLTGEYWQLLDLNCRD